MIDFDNNSLQGKVPKSLANCVKLKFLNHEDNQITDVFPSWLGTLPEGEIPQATQFSTFTNDSFVGNPGLCGEPLPRKCENSDASPAEDDLYSESVFAFRLETVLAGCASGTIIGVALGYIFSTRKYE
ncbi:hypothetical protein WN943_011248 [Citrus x changshan-huyou]